MTTTKDKKTAGPVQAYAKLEGEYFCYYIQTLQVTLGRKVKTPDNVDIPLGNIKSVSRQHARLFYNFTTQRFEMMVFGKNGAFVNEQFIEKGVTVPLENKTKIQIGEVSFIFLLPRMDVEEPESSAAAVGPITTTTTYAPLQQLEKNTLKKRFMSTSEDEHHDMKQELINTQDDESWYESIHAKPPFSYASLIAQAIHSSRNKRMTLNGIYTFITTNFPYYQLTSNGWQNSIRHNLSLNKAFIKVARKDSEPGKGAFWTIDPTCQEQFTKGIYKKMKKTYKRVKLTQDDDSGDEEEDGNEDDDEDDDEGQELVAVEFDPEEEVIPDLQAQLQNTIRQHLLDPLHHPLPPSIAQLLPQAIAQLPPQLAVQLSATLQSALKNRLDNNTTPPS